MKRFILPLCVFLVLVGFLALGLQRDPSLVPSPLVGKPAPVFSLPRLDTPAETFSPQDMHGKVWLLNVWASWCEACRDEHATLLNLAHSGVVPIVGMDYKDKSEDALAWLANAGNPYSLTVMDADGRVGIDYGVYGVPETYVIDKAGRIAYKQVGVLGEAALNETILPLLRKLQAEAVLSKSKLSETTQ